MKAHVIFLHGLGGHPYRTWQATRDEKSLWPRWLAEDIDGLAVWSVGYEAPISRWKGTAMHLVDRAENILGRFLTQPELKNGRIILIGHSLGGLVIKQLFRTLEMEARKTATAASLLDRIDKVAFLATPHTGADLAVWATAGAFSCALRRRRCASCATTRTCETSTIGIANGPTRTDFRILF